MALFEKIFKKSTTNASSSSVNTDTIKEISSSKVSLTKAQDGLNRSIVRLTKKTGVELNKHKAKVFVVIDRSGSMYDLYYNGDVQDVLTRLLPLALKFDDNGELEVYVFNHDCSKMPPMNLSNYKNYVKNIIINHGYCPSGGTNYSPVIKQTIKDYDDNSSIPAFGIFITDGENSDASETDKAIRKSSEHKIFYKFVGIGNEKFNYLQKLDNLSGRNVDNTAFIKVKDFSKLSDDELYDKLLEQYPEWLKAMSIN